MSEEIENELAENEFKMGERVFTMPRGGIRKIGRWKDDHLMPIVTQIFDLQHVGFDVELVGDDGKLGDLGAILGQVQPVVMTLLDSSEAIANAMLAWLEPTDEDADYLLDEVPLEDYLPPLMWVVGQVFPVGKLTAAVGGIQALTGTPSNSPKANGAGPKKKRGKKK